MQFPDLVQKFLRRLSGRPKQPGPPARQTPEAGGQPAARIPLCAAPAAALQQARLDALNAEQEVAQISRAHLSTLMASPPRHRMAHLTDPELTPADRVELANAVRSALPVAFLLTFPRWRPIGLIRRLRLACGYRCIVAMVALVVCAVPGALAVRNTGTRLVGSDATWIVDWHLPDGTVHHGVWNARIPAVAMRTKNGIVVLRHWLNGRGYATTEVDERWLLNHSFIYVVAPTGSTGAASPASR